MVDAAQRRALAFDAALVLAVPKLLAAVHFLVPPDFQQTLAFGHASFRVYTLFTSAYVADSSLLLYGNLVGYGVSLAAAYALCVETGERRWFRYTFVLDLLVLPVLVNLTSYAVRSPSATPVEHGFSAVVAGFGGLLLVALVAFVARRHGSALAAAVGLSLVFCLVQLVDLRYAGSVRPPVTGLVALGVGLTFVPYVRGGVDLPASGDRRDAVVTAVAVALAGVVLAALLLGLFPRTVALASGETATDAFAHAAGLLWGAVVALTTWVVARGRGHAPSQVE
ncbi:MAG: hypothetical protein ABEJ82_06240 [Haloplanus sp.]